MIVAATAVGAAVFRMGRQRTKKVALAAQVSCTFPGLLSALQNSGRLHSLLAGTSFMQTCAGNRYMQHWH